MDIFPALRTNVLLICVQLWICTAVVKATMTIFVGLDLNPHECGNLLRLDKVNEFHVQSLQGDNGTCECYLEIQKGLFRTAIVRKVRKELFRLDTNQWGSLEYGSGYNYLYMNFTREAIIVRKNSTSVNPGLGSFEMRRNLLYLVLTTNAKGDPAPVTITCTNQVGVIDGIMKNEVDNIILEGKTKLAVIIGVPVVVALLILICICCCCRFTKSKNRRKSEGHEDEEDETHPQSSLFPTPSAPSPSNSRDRPLRSHNEIL